MYIYVPVYRCTQDASRLDAIHASLAHTHMYNSYVNIFIYTKYPYVYNIHSSIPR